MIDIITWIGLSKSQRDQSTYTLLYASDRRASWVGGLWRAASLAFSPDPVLASPPAGEVYRSYYFAGGQRMAMRVEGDPEGANNGLFFFLRDHLGSTTVTLKRSSSGPLVNVAKLRYYPWAENRPSGYDASDTYTVYRFTDQRLEDYIKLYWYGSRWKSGRLDVEKLDTYSSLLRPVCAALCRKDP